MVYLRNGLTQGRRKRPQKRNGSSQRTLYQAECNKSDRGNGRIPADNEKAYCEGMNGGQTIQDHQGQSHKTP
nr:MAG TPA: hypothetical protein [Caudoviricetes sp.]